MQYKINSISSCVVVWLFFITIPASAEDEDLDLLLTKNCKKCLSAQQLSICGNSSLGGNVVVSGNESIRGNLLVAGDSTFFGNTTVEGNQVVQGTSNFSSGTFSSDVTISGTLNVTNLNVPASSPGTPGVPGIGGALAYGYFYSTIESQTIDSQAPVLFYSAGPMAGGISAGTLPSDEITIQNAGTYRFQFDVRATTTSANDYLLFELRSNNGLTQIAGSQYVTTLSSVTGMGVQALQVAGFALANLLANSNIELINAGSNTVTTSTQQTGNANSASLLIERIA